MKILILMRINWARSVGVLLLEDDKKPGDKKPGGKKPGGKKPGGKQSFAVLGTEEGIQDVKYECDVEYVRLWAAYMKQIHKWMKIIWRVLCNRGGNQSEYLHVVYTLFHWP